MTDLNLTVRVSIIIVKCFFSSNQLLESIIEKNLSKSLIWIIVGVRVNEGEFPVFGKKIYEILIISGEKTSADSFERGTSVLVKWNVCRICVGVFVSLMFEPTFSLKSSYESGDSVEVRLRLRQEVDDFLYTERSVMPDAGHNNLLLGRKNHTFTHK